MTLDRIEISRALPMGTTSASGRFSRAFFALLRSRMTAR